MCRLYCNALDRNKYGSNPLVTINTEQLPSALKVLARALEQEFGECRYLYYGIGEPNSPLSVGSEGQSLLEMQQHFSDRLWQEITDVVQKSKKALFVGHSLGLLAEQSVARGAETVWISTSARANNKNLEIHNADLLTADPGTAFDVIVIEGSYHYLDQLPILNKCREVIRSDGDVYLFGEYLDDDSAIQQSRLANLSSFKQLSDRLGYELILEQDLTLEVQSALPMLSALLQQQGPLLIQRKLATHQGFAELKENLQLVADEFNSGRRAYRLFHLTKVANPTGEYINAEYGGIDTFQPDEVAELFEKSFNKGWDAELWHWKYTLGNGKCIVARQHRGGEIVSHYGGVPREIYYFGKASVAIQPCDVMVLPEIRKHYGKSSLFFKAAATFLEREIGNTVNHLLGFGFPNKPTMNTSIRLGLYEKTDDFIEVLYLTPTDKSEGKRFSWSSVDINNPMHQQVVDALWEKMWPNFPTGIIGMRHSQYLKYRYYDHPYSVTNLYQCLMLKDGSTNSPVAIAVLKIDGDRKLVMDLICPIAAIKEVLTQLNQLVKKDAQAVGLKMWITRGWLDAVRLEGAIVNELGIEIPCNSWNPGPSSETLYGAWWLTAGDIDFM